MFCLQIYGHDKYAVNKNKSRIQLKKGAKQKNTKHTLKEQTQGERGKETHCCVFVKRKKIRT